MSEIKVIEAPSVYLLARPSIDRGELGRFLADEGVPDWTTDATTDAETLVEFGGRACYMSFAKPRPGGHAAYVGNILASGHGSVTEHGWFSLAITGISRTCSHEIVRHRVGISPSQLSQRFVDESDCAFVVPPAFLPHKGEYDEWHAEFRRWSNLHDDHPMQEPRMSGRAETYESWRSALIHAQTYYQHLADRLVNDYAPWADKTAKRKSAREAARSVLPGCVETKMILTGNVRAWRHLLEMRGSDHADAEIRRLSLAILAKLKPEAPDLFGDLTVAQSDRDGSPVITSKFRKV